MDIVQFHQRLYLNTFASSIFMFEVCQWIRDFLTVFVFVLLVHMPKALEDRILMAFLFSCLCFVNTLFFCYATCHHLRWTWVIYKDLCNAIYMWLLAMTYTFTFIELPLVGLFWIVALLNAGCIFSLVDLKYNVYVQ